MRCYKLCGHPRYKSRRRESTKHKGDVPYKRMYYFPLIPKLQRLYALKATTEGMRWQDDHDKEDGVMHHPFDFKAWLHFDQMHLSFSIESRNVILGL